MIPDATLTALVLKYGNAIKYPVEAINRVNTGYNIYGGIGMNTRIINLHLASIESRYRIQYDITTDTHVVVDLNDRTAIVDSNGKLL